MTDHMEFWKQLAQRGTHRIQIRILEVARRGEAFSPNGLAEELNEKLNNVSYHVRALREKELIVLVRTEPRRGAVEHFYRAADEVLDAQPKVGPSEEVALAALEDPFFEAIARGVSVDQVADRFAQVAARSATREAVAT